MADRPMRYLTVEQVAEVLQIHPESVRRLLRTGRLKGTRPWGSKSGWRVAANVVEDFVRGDQTPTEG